MERVCTYLRLSCLCLWGLLAATAFPQTAADSLHVRSLEEAVVTSQPKEHASLARSPLAVTTLGAEELRESGVEAVKDITALAPNLYMPDYGSRLTSAVYVRGVGSRINTPAVGLYVDNIPYADKSAYDFHFLDIARVDVLRGPQGTLYGRGAMGGLLRVFTSDPFARSGTDISLGMTSRETGRHISATTRLHPSEKVAMSISAFYKGDEGFRHNTTTQRKADGSDVAGAHIRLGWRPTKAWRIDLTASYQYSNEDSNPYVYEGPADNSREDEYPLLRNQISQNRQSGYRRNLFTTGLNAQWTRNRLTLTSITSYQFLQDRLFMDQDYLRADIFSLEQRQRAQSVSEELTLKGWLPLTLGKQEAAWQWSVGAFFLYDYKHTTCPVNFYSDGVSFLNSTFRRVIPAFIQLEFSDATLPFFARLQTPGTNAAVFHQSTLKNFFVPRLSLTAGIRLDYDRHSLTLHSPANAYNYRFLLSMPAFGLDIDQPFASNAAFGGHDSETNWQVLPHVALQYDFKGNRGSIYFAVSKGYRSGGYNLENYSDISQILLRRNIMQQVADFSTATIQSLPLPEASKQTAISGMTKVIAQNMPDAPEVHQLAYKPETAWSHEVGFRLNIPEAGIRADGAAFVQTTHQLQVAQFSPSGLGREIHNAGSSITYGMELSLRGSWLDRRLTAKAAYGLAHSTFTDYYLGKVDGEDVSYKGNHVPFAPEHTLAVSAAFRQPLQNKKLCALSFGADLTGAGRIWWDEANTFSRPFSMQVGLRCEADFAHNWALSLWARNITASRYRTFSFDTMGRRFSQFGDPFHMGIDLSWHF